MDDSRTAAATPVTVPAADGEMDRPREVPRRSWGRERLRLVFRQLRPITKPFERALRTGRDLAVGATTLPLLKIRGQQQHRPSPWRPGEEPLVTVVVPNFNHARFLRQRLDSIYAQTYRPIRVLLLDDGSTDGSRGILDEYQAKYADKTTCHYNAANSGGVFRQWRKAFELACDSPLIWIAESDDFCATDFLEKLVPFFQEESIMLAFARPRYVNENGQPHSFTFHHHVSSPMVARKWNRDYVETGHREVECALGIKNTIPNVSGVVFRPPPPDTPLLEDETWLNMKVCGDWMLYLHLLAGGKLAYCTRTTNYFRFHADSSSGKTHADDLFFREHERVAEEIARLYRVPGRVLDLNRELLKHHYRAMTGRGDKDFGLLFNARKVADARAQRKPTTMISLPSFGPGGPVMSIRQANELKRTGVPVLVHCCDDDPDEPQVRSMLRRDIPVVRATSETQILNMLREFAPDVMDVSDPSLKRRLMGLSYIVTRARRAA